MSKMTEDDPLLDVADAWAYVRDNVEQAVKQADAAEGVAREEGSALGPATCEAGAREALLTLLCHLQERALARAPSRATFPA